MSYTPPDSHNVVFDFDGKTYTPPDSHNVVFDFGTSSSTSQYLALTGIDSLDFGGTTAIPSIAGIFPLGFDTFAYGGHKLFQSRFINSPGFSALGIGTAVIKNKNQNVNPLGLNALSPGFTTIYNLRQYLSLLSPSRGFNSALYGTAYVQGGVKYVTTQGNNVAIVTNPTVINTRATQYANLNILGGGIAPPSLSNPSVSPRMLYPRAVIAWSFGAPTVQRNPSPKGFINSFYGTAWISHSPRYLTPKLIEAYSSGYPRIFDPLQKVFINTVIPGGIFGDISIRNTRRLLIPQGFNSQQFSNWLVFESTLKTVDVKSIAAQVFGHSNVYNKTPSIIPKGFNAFLGLSVNVGYRIRTLKPSGFDLLKLGTHILTKTPELKLTGISSAAVGNLVISNRIRHIYAGVGKDTQVFGGLTVWHYSRKFNPTGIKIDTYGLPRIEHGLRALLVPGYTHTAYGYGAWISFAKRMLYPGSITAPNIATHQVGGTRNIRPSGYVATLFGSRIVPESQSLYPEGFSNPFGLTVIDLRKKYIRTIGFLTTGQEGGHRFGTHRIWNLRQYITQYFDVDSGLVPPKWTGWTGIENRNKRIGTIGNDASRIATPFVINNARPIYLNGINSLVVGKLMIAERVRRLKLQGLEAPYIGNWQVIYNAAFMITSAGKDTQSFGSGKIVNTRRYFDRIGNFESLVMGKPMISDRIRKLTFEQRYAIAPPYIALPKVDLYSRYIEYVGRDEYQAFGQPILNIRWNVITPRWTMRDAYGDASLKNLTPELKTRGRNAEEFGTAAVRLQWRPLLQQGREVILWGNGRIEYRDRSFSVPGFTQWSIPVHKVIKTGIPPYWPQYLWLDEVEIDGIKYAGKGIEPPYKQVSEPSLRTNVLAPLGFIATAYSTHHLQSNGILVQPGLQELTIGNAAISLKNRVVGVSSLGDLLQFGKPRLSPWTIYVLPNPPQQAVDNHTYKGFHFVNSDGGSRAPGEVFGQAIIALKHRRLNNVGGYVQNEQSNNHKVDLRRRYIDLANNGIRSLRTGIHILGPFNQEAIQFESTNTQEFGRAALTNSSKGAHYIKPYGGTAPEINKPFIDFFNRNIFTKGSNHLLMGAQISNDKPFMWQGLRIGPLVLGRYGGFENQKFGQYFISLKVRNLEVKGFDGFNADMDITNFKGRLKVILAKQPVTITSQMIKPLSILQPVCGLPNVWLKVHYIRPDGNSEQFRKGGGF